MKRMVSAVTLLFIAIILFGKFYTDKDTNQLINASSDDDYILDVFQQTYNCTLGLCAVNNIDESKVELGGWQFHLLYNDNGDGILITDTDILEGNKYSWNTACINVQGKSCDGMFSGGELYEALYGVNDDGVAMQVTGGSQDGVVKKWMNNLSNTNDVNGKKILKANPELLNGKIIPYVPSADDLIKLGMLPADAKDYVVNRDCWGSNVCPPALSDLKSSFINLMWFEDYKNGLARNEKRWALSTGGITDWWYAGTNYAQSDGTGGRPFMIAELEARGVFEVGLYPWEKQYGVSTRLLLNVKIPVKSIKDILYHAAISDLQEGLNAVKDTKAGEISVKGLGAYELSIVTDGIVNATDKDWEGNYIGNQDSGSPLSNDFELSNIDEEAGTADLKIKNNLSAGTYYIKIKAKDMYDESDASAVYPNEENRIVERIIKITVKPSQPASNNPQLSSFSFVQVENLRLNIEAIANHKAGDFVTIPNGYSMQNIIVATPDSETTNEEASQFSVKGNSSGATLDIINDLKEAKVYALRVYLTDQTTSYYEDIRVNVNQSYPFIKSLGYDSPYIFAYKDEKVSENSNKSIGSAKIQLSDTEDGNSPYSFALIDKEKYPDNEYFTVDATTGTIKYNGSKATVALPVNADGYTIFIEATDSHGQTKSDEVKIIVNKASQEQYRITNDSNYSFKYGQEINITTSGNESGENETYTITSGSNVAQIVGNKFKLLSSGTFTLQATVGGNTNYTSKTVTKQITVSQLPTQNPPVSITSSDSFVYGDTYTPSYSGGQGSGAVSWAIENDNGTGAVLNNGAVKVTGVGTFTLKVTKAGTSSYQESTVTKLITVKKRKTIVKPKDVTKTVGQTFKDNGATYNPQPVSGDNLGTLTITSKYPDNQAAGRYTDGIQASGLSNPNYDFEYQEGTLIINSNSLPNNGDGYYKVTGTKGKNNWYVSDVQISTTNKNGYDEISKDGVNFQKAALVYSTDGDYPTEFYLRNSSTGIIAKAIRYQLKIDQTPPDVPSLSMKEINKNAIARFINALSFGNWMNQAVQVTITSTDTTSGIDHYEYNETSQSGTNTKTSANGIVTYKDDVEIIVKAKACDKAGNCSALSNDESIMIDTKAPTISGVKDKSEYKHYYLPRFVNVKDSYSGLSYSEYKKDGTMVGTIQNNVDEKISDIGEYEVYAIDNAGNEVTISFKIVPLPDIETEIDGSDESKEIIDQIKDELAEIKDKIDETEKKDIEDWIKDALEKWNSLRKKVVETDDKSAKIEGQGDTDFDPSVILIVDDITDQENNIPPLPRKAIAIYDVYLQKGNIRIQPDGSIKVYLPYVGNIGKAMGGAIDSLADPIVYQIDEKDKVTELKVQREGNFVTFITDKLLRYAISDENQKCPLDGIEINIDTDVDGKPDVNIDIDGDCKADLNIDTDGDGQPNTNIDTDLDGKPDYNIDIDEDGKPDVNIGPVNEPFKPTVCKTVNGLEYCSDPYKKAYLNIDSDGDGRPDINIDLDGDMEADINIDIDGDNIPDIDIDSDGDGAPDINIDTDKDGKADKNIVKLTKWKPDKNVDGSIKYDTMSNLISLLNGNDENDSNQLNKQISGVLASSNTGDSTKPFLWWIMVIINLIMMIYGFIKVKKEKEENC